MAQANTIGNKHWAMAAGRVPLLTTGQEPMFTSRDSIAILNTSMTEAAIEMTIFYEDGDVEVYHAVVSGRRIKKIRFNDLIDPLPVPLDKPFGFLLKSNVEVVVQFTRMDTSTAYGAAFCVTPYYNS